MVFLVPVRLIRKVEWVDDDDRENCKICKKSFGLMRRRHHCRLCGEVICDDCSPDQVLLKSTKSRARACVDCYAIASENYKRLQQKTSKRTNGSSANSEQDSQFAVEDGPASESPQQGVSLFLPSLGMCVVAALLAATGTIKFTTAGGFSLWTIGVILLLHRWLRGGKAKAPEVESTVELEDVQVEVGEPRIPAQYEDMIKQKIADLHKFSKARSGEDGWSLLKTKHGIEMWKKEGDGLNMIMGRGEVDGPPRAALDVIVSQNIETVRKMDDMLDVVTPVETLNNQTSITHNLYKAVWPTSSRDFLLLSHWQAAPDGSLLIVATDSPTHSADPKTGGVRGSCDMGGWLLRPLAGGRTHVTYAVMVDLGGSVPAWLVNQLSEGQPMQIREIGKIISTRNMELYQPGAVHGSLANSDTLTVDAAFERQLLK